jgi:hypothetical protein
VSHGHEAEVDQLRRDPEGPPESAAAIHVHVMSESHVTVTATR